MCFSFQLMASAQELEKRYQKSSSPQGHLFEKKALINAFDFKQHPIILKDKKEIQFYHWGLIPQWAKDDHIKKYTLNARIETLSKKPSFRSSIQMPCLIPATGFYEWQWLDSKGKQKRRYLIKKEKGTIFSMAGLFSHWKHPQSGEIISSFTLLTTKANSLMAQIHNTKQRMPVILHPEDERTWLNATNYKQFAYPYQTALVAKEIN